MHLHSSVRRAPQLWLEPTGQILQVSRCETLADLLKAEINQALAV